MTWHCVPTGQEGGRGASSSCLPALRLHRPHTSSRLHTPSINSSGRIGGSGWVRGQGGGGAPPRASEGRDADRVPDVCVAPVGEGGAGQGALVRAPLAPHVPRQGVGDVWEYGCVWGVMRGGCVGACFVCVGMCGGGCVEVSEALGMARVQNVWGMVRACGPHIFSALPLYLPCKTHRLWSCPCATTSTQTFRLDSRRRSNTHRQLALVLPLPHRSYSTQPS